MPTKIKSDYKPRPRVAELLAVRYPELTVEMAAEFIGHELPEFIMFWENTGKPMSDWDSTCLNRMKDLYAWKKEKMALNRSPSNNKGDVFSDVMDKISDRVVTIGAQNEPEVTGRYRLPEPPKPGPAMKPEDAFAQLRNSGVIK